MILTQILIYQKNKKNKRNNIYKITTYKSMRKTNNITRL